MIGLHDRLPILHPIDSVTHAHLILAAARELAGRSSREPVRVLDVGCGNGRLMSAVARHLPGLIGKPLEIVGFDVSDVAVQRRGFFEQTEQYLRAQMPEVDWKDRLFLRRSGEAWPADAGTVDLVLTNQVLEHVEDLSFFLSELERVLSPHGVSLNLFPTRRAIIEGHTGVPLAHIVRSADNRRRYMERFAKLGLAFLGPLRMDGTLEAAEWARSRSDYIHSQTWYRSWKTLGDAAKDAHLQASYRWTPDFYFLKLAYTFGRPSLVRYFPLPSAIVEAAFFAGLQYISSVSICFEKGTMFDPGGYTSDAR